MVSWKVVSCQFVEQSLDIEIGHFIEEFDLYLAPLHVPNVQNTLASNDNEWVIAMFHFCQKQIDFLRNKFAFSWIYSFSNIDYTGSRKHHKSPHNNHMIHFTNSTECLLSRHRQFHSHVKIVEMCAMQLSHSECRKLLSLEKEERERGEERE